MRKKKRRKVKEKVKKLNEKKENERMQPRRVKLFLKKRKENVIVDTFCLFFLCFFCEDFVKFKNKLRTFEPRFWEKIKNNRASF